MDAMMQAYMEETEEMLQKAEECIIRLEMDYSATDVNELFRIAHTIKGSSHMVGYEEIGNLMHKIEDMLDCARNGTILFDQRIVSLCFEGLDIVKKMLQFKTEPCSEEIMLNLTNSAFKISETVEIFIKSNKKVDENRVVSQPGSGIVSSLMKKEVRGKNKYYISFFIEEDAPMISPVLIMILRCVEEIGTLVYSSFTDDYFDQRSINLDIKTFDIMICTDIDKAELYTYFALFYVEKLNILDMSRDKLEENDHYFNNDFDNSYKIILTTTRKLCHLLFNKNSKVNKREGLNIIETLRSEANSACENINKENINTFKKDLNDIYGLIIPIYNGKSNTDERYFDIKSNIIKLLERGYKYTKGKFLFCVYKAEKDDFIQRFKNFIDMMNRSSTIIVLIDLSKLDLLDENEVKDLIEIKKKFNEQGIEIGIIVEGTSARRIVNIFDSIKPVEKFNVFRSEIEVVGMFL